MPGASKVRLTVTYSPTAFPPISPPPAVIVKVVNVLPADGFVLTAGYNTSTWNGFGIYPNAQLLEVNFKITCAGKDAGPMIAGFPQELITNKVGHVDGQDTRYPDDDTWTPSTAAQGGTTFYKQGNLIIDMKGTNIDADTWSLIKVDEVFYTFTQTLRIQWTDPCGGVHISALGSITLARKKVSETEWQLIAN